MSNKYEYLFPFEKVDRGSKILIYGAGDVGQEYLQQLLMTGYCDVLGFVDRNWDKYEKMVVPIYSPSEIVNLDYDCIVLALKTGVHKKNIYNTLNKLGVDLSQVVFQKLRRAERLLVEIADNEMGMNRTFAFQATNQAIALKFGPGLGDCIQRKIFVNALVRIMPECQIDIYTPNGDNIRSLYADIKNIKNIFDDAGALYFSQYKHYLLAVEVFFLLKVDWLNQKTAMLTNTLQLLKENCERYGLAAFPVTQGRIHLERTIYTGGSCYSFYDYTGVMREEDKKVYIPLMKSSELSFEALQMGRYVTIHTGSAIAGDNCQNLDARQWPQAYYQEFVECFKKKYPDITLVQIGDEKTRRLQDIDWYLFGESIELVKCVLKNAIFHFSTEGGLMHLATQLGTKCITVFGPTQVQLFGYKQNVNLVSDRCSGCYCLYDESFSCARGMEQPECMYSITPEMVMEKVETYLGGKVEK